MIAAAESLLACLADEARAHYPREACGVVLGRAMRRRLELVACQPLANRDDRVDRFRIDPESLWLAAVGGRSERLEILGVYHSHPNAGAEPSRRDLAGAWGEHLWLITSCGGRAECVTRCWQPGPRGFREIRLVPLDEGRGEA